VAAFFPLSPVFCFLSANAKPFFWIVDFAALRSSLFQDGWSRTRWLANVLPFLFSCSALIWFVYVGGKAKPLKAPKKEKKELDDDDLAFKERQRAG